MKFKYNDGGRKKAGFKGTTGDCVVRALAIASNKPYKQIYDEVKLRNLRFSMDKNCKVAKAIKKTGCSPRHGVYKDVYEIMMKDYGFTWVACMGIGTGCKVHLKKNELPKGRIICRLSKHLVAVVNGVVNDLDDCSRNGTRCVYGYWYK